MKSHKPEFINIIFNNITKKFENNMFVVFVIICVYDKYMDNYIILSKDKTNTDF